jgi:hypothetical protein
MGGSAVPHAQPLWMTVADVSECTQVAMWEGEEGRRLIVWLLLWLLPLLLWLSVGCHHFCMCHVTIITVSAAVPLSS